MRKIPQIENRKHPAYFKKSRVAASNDTLRHLAFDNSLQANIIFTVNSGKIIMANRAACKLLGYFKKELLTKSRADIFKVSESSFNKMLKQRKGRESMVVVVGIKKSGKPFPCEISSALFMDEDAVEKAITTIADISKNLLKQINIDIKKARIVAHDIVLAKSKQKGIDIKKEKIVAHNILAAKSRQKGIDIKKGKIVAHNIVLAKEKQKGIDAKKAKIVAGNIVQTKSRQKRIDTEKTKIVAHNIKLALAKSGEEKLEQEMAIKAEYKESFKLIFNASPDVVLFDSDLVTNKVIISDAYEKEFGYKITSNMTQAEDWISHIHPDDKEAVMQDYARMLASEEIEWKYSYRFLRADNSVANVSSSRIILRNAFGKAYRMIGSIHDESKQKVLEERLEEEIMLKEEQIAIATEEAKESERSYIGKELHDNVNQLLGASRLYLDMAKQGGENSKMYLVRSSDYTLRAIEEIRKLTKGLTTSIIRNLGLREAIDTVTRDMMEVNPVKISCALEHFKEQSVNDKFKLNIFRIVQEQLNNILKHAKATEIAICLLQDKKSIMLTIADNGIGFDTSQKRKGIGLENIKNRVASYNGTADFVSQPGQGCILNVTFSVTDSLLNKSGIAAAQV
jgi:PAS domain S-box-containing protein